MIREYLPHSMISNSQVDYLNFNRRRAFYHLPVFSFRNYNQQMSLMKMGTPHHVNHQRILHLMMAWFLRGANL